MKGPGGPRGVQPVEALLGLLAVVLLPVAAFSLKRWGLGPVQRRLLALPVPGSGARMQGRDTREATRRLARIVDVAARRGPWRANCLQRSLVLWWFLHLRGLPGEIRIGVRRRPGSPAGSRSLDFHAWVEHEGVVLNDVQSVRERFATFDRAIAPLDARWR